MNSPILSHMTDEGDPAKRTKRAARHDAAGVSCKRARYVVDWPLQLQLTRQFAGLALLALLLICADLYIVAALTESYAATLPTHIGQRAAIWLYAALAIAVNVGLFFVVALFYSHRLAGPQLKLVRCLEQIEEGNLDLPPLRFRNKDYLHDVAGALNSAFQEWNLRINTVRGILESLKQQVSELERPDLIEGISRAEEVLTPASSTRRKSRNRST